MSSRTDEQTDRARGGSRGRSAGIRVACAAAVVSALMVAGGGPALAASPGSRSLPRPAPQAAHPAAAAHTAADRVAAGQAAAGQAAHAGRAAAAARAVPADRAAPAAHAAAPGTGIGARSRAIGADDNATTLVTTTGGDGAAQADPPAVVSAVDVIMAAPAASRPGGTVELRTFADCAGSGSGIVTSPALAAPATLVMAADGGLFAEAAVAADAKPGDYPLVETCAGKTVASGQLTVRSLGAPATGGGWGATRIADAGSGLTPALGLADLRSAGGAPSRADEYASLGLIAAATVGAVLFAYQRRRAACRG